MAQFSTPVGHFFGPDFDDKLNDKLAVRGDSTSLKGLIQLAISLDNRLRDRHRGRTGKTSLQILDLAPDL